MPNAISPWASQRLLIQNLMASLAYLAIVFTAMASPAAAQMELPIEHRLPLQTAIEAASAAISTCQAQGSAVSVSVVDQHGQSIAQLQGDHAAPHTFSLSKKKAYTAAAMAPLQGVKRTSEVAAGLRAGHQAIGDLALPTDSIDEITPIAGGIIIEINKEVVGAIGVSGARSGIEDENCAESGLLTITKTHPP
jgi:uncharacterized protein GlcG (DUF336 family)